MIKLVGVEKTLGGQPVLCGVDLTIPAGKLTTIIGRSGGGKSVLLKHMIGLLQPDRGQVWVDGIEISRLRGKALNEVRKRFAMLFQGAALFDSLTVFENVAFPLREKLRLADAEVVRRVEEMLEQVGLSGMGHKFPAELSGGMKKRAGLARALVMEPEIILFDRGHASDVSLHGDHGEPRDTGNLFHFGLGGDAQRRKDRGDGAVGGIPAHHRSGDPRIHRHRGITTLNHEPLGS